MASWGLNVLPYRALQKLINSTNIANWNDTPNLLYTLLGCVFILIKMESINKHKDIQGLVKEIYHEWEWGISPDFINDLKTKSAEDFAIQFHHGIGMQIRNSYGFWKGDTDLCKWFISQGITDPDEMSHKVFLELYEYGRNMQGLS